MLCYDFTDCVLYQNTEHNSSTLQRRSLFMMDIQKVQLQLLTIITTMPMTTYTQQSFSVLLWQAIAIGRQYSYD